MSYMQHNLALSGGVQELSLDEIEYVSGGSVNAPPGSPYLGINPWVLDCLENLYYGREYGGGNLWFSPAGEGFYRAYDENGDYRGLYTETTQGNSTRSISGGSSLGYDSTNIQSSGTVYLRPI